MEIENTEKLKESKLNWKQDTNRLLAGRPRFLQQC